MPRTTAFVTVLRPMCRLVFSTSATLATAGDCDDDHRSHAERSNVQVGVRPFYLVEGMDDIALKGQAEAMRGGPVLHVALLDQPPRRASRIPEHSRESYEAAHRMGAGIIECDVTFTRDGELVCQHSECDLHTTTNIVATPLNNACTVLRTKGGPAPKCCTSDSHAVRVHEPQGEDGRQQPDGDDGGGLPGWYASVAHRPLHRSTGGQRRDAEGAHRADQEWGVGQTPELKAGDPARIQAIFGGQAQYAQRMIDTYKAAGVDPQKVWAQSFNLDDILYWVHNEPAFGRQAVYLDSVDPRRIHRSRARRMRNWLP